MAKSEFGLFLDQLANDPSVALQASFVKSARANMPNRDAAEPSSGDAGDATGFSTAGARVDYLVKCYRAREDVSATYADAMSIVLSQPQNAALKIAFAKESGRGGRG